jgi:hypothetical protein
MQGDEGVSVVVRYINTQRLHVALYYSRPAAEHVG